MIEKYVINYSMKIINRYNVFLTLLVTYQIIYYI